MEKEAATAYRRLAVGVDLGTTHCSMAVYLNDQVIVIPEQVDAPFDPSSSASASASSSSYSTATPAMVAFLPDGSVLVGSKARDHPHPENVVYGAKRLLARRYRDPLLQKELQHRSFRVVEEEATGRPLFQVLGGRRAVSPEQALGLVLRHVKENAERYLGLGGGAIEEAVVTVPSHFTDAQRECVKRAAAEAGLRVQRMVSESTAACICYGFAKPMGLPSLWRSAMSAAAAEEESESEEEEPSGQAEGEGKGKEEAEEQGKVDRMEEEEKERRERVSIPTSPRFFAKNVETTVLLMDLGGGFLNVSILTIGRGVHEVLAVAGTSTPLGGEDLTSRLMSYHIDEWKRQNLASSSSLEEDAEAASSPMLPAKSLFALRQEVERLKCGLSKDYVQTLEVKGFMDEQSTFRAAPMNRLRFNEINADFFEKCIHPVEQVLRDAKLEKSDIDHVLLLGGTTQYPKVASILEEFFMGKDQTAKNVSKPTIIKDLNRDPSVVARGAAIQAAILKALDRDTKEQEMETAAFSSKQEEEAQANKLMMRKALKEFLLLDVAPNSVGVVTAGGVMTKIVRRNTTIPVRHSLFFTISKKEELAFENAFLQQMKEQGQALAQAEGTSQLKKLLKIRLLEGEKANASDNNFLEELELPLSPINPSEEEEKERRKIRIEFSLNASNDLQVIAEEFVIVGNKEQKEGNKASVMVHYGKQRIVAAEGEQQRTPHQPQATIYLQDCLLPLY
ncbi:Hsp70 ATPase ssa1 [Balamuthia mandrillaris]